MLTLARSGSPVRHLNGAVNRLLSDFFAEAPEVHAHAGPRLPFLDVWEGEDCLYAELDLPGYTMKDLEVLVHGDTLTVRGQRESGDREGIGWLRRERRQGSFERAVRLPYEIDADQVEASLRNGVLNVKLPKSEHERPRKIPVKVAADS